MQFEVGQVVGEYKVVRVLGQGGLGAVYEATHLISQRSEAMKVMLPEQMGTPQMADRFLREIQLLGTLNHPNISCLHNAFYYHDQQLIMILELVKGEDLRSISARGRIDLPLLLSFADQILQALHYAHLQGVVHRDIKPANIMVTADGHIKVLDFGIAIAERSASLTSSGAIIGSPAYMSPEQILGKKATPQSDIYAVGVTLYELLAGAPPLTGETTYSQMNAHVNVIPERILSVRPDLPPRLSDALAKSLEKKPADRFATAEEFLLALRACQAEATSSAQAPLPAYMQPTVFAPSNTPRPPLATHPGTSSGPQQQVNAGAGNLPTETVTRHLAGFIGPIAKVIVSRISKQCTDVDQLYTEASKQIEDTAERQRFLRTRPR